MQLLELLENSAKIHASQLVSKLTGDKMCMLFRSSALDLSLNESLAVSTGIGSRSVNLCLPVVCMHVVCMHMQVLLACAAYNCHDLNTMQQQSDQQVSQKSYRSEGSASAASLDTSPIQAP